MDKKQWDRLPEFDRDFAPPDAFDEGFTMSDGARMQQMMDRGRCRGGSPTERLLREAARENAREAASKGHGGMEGP